MRSGSRVLVAAVLVAPVVLALASTTAFAGYRHQGTFVMAGGITTPVGETNPYLNSSGSFFFGGGRNINQRFAVEVEYTHNWLAVDPVVIEMAQSDSTQLQDVHASLWSVTLNGILRFNEDSDIVPWITAGGGYYKRNLQLTQAALIYYPPIFDPWWGWIDGGWSTGEAIVGQRSATGIGYNVGFGIDLEIEQGTSLFLEVRYHQAFMDGVDMQIVPVMAGVRW